MKRILLTLALVAAATPIVQAVREEAEESESSCRRCAPHTRERTCRSCEDRWHPFKHNCNRGYCDKGCNV